MPSPQKHDSPGNMHIEQANSVGIPQQIDDVEEAKEATLNEVCLSRIREPIAKSTG